MPKRSSSRSRTAAHKYALVLDVGTTGVKAFVFAEDGRIVSRAHHELKKKFPRRGWVEQDPRELVRVSIAVMREAVRSARVPARRLIGLGIAVQRETTILWHHHTGVPVYPAIVWEDRRTDGYCKRLQKKYGKLVRARTGLPIDAYFSASKIRWLMDHVPAVRRLLTGENVDFGNVDSWLLYNLLDGRPHLTDQTNASRTLLYDIRKERWSGTLMKLFGIPEGILPNVRPSVSKFGILKKSVLGFPLPVRAVCGDQQASLYAAGTARGTTVVTYGTGTFVKQSLGRRFTLHPTFMTTLAPGAVRPEFALESKIDRSAVRVTRLLKRPAALRRALRTLARAVDMRLRALPIRPRSIVIDGGITRDGIIAGIQQSISKIRVRPQKTFDGTALGIAKLVFRSIV